MLLNCPKAEHLLELVSIPDEISFFRRFSLRSHALSCRTCREKMDTIRGQWDGYFKPKPDITSSLMSVYSRLQNDETLILKGWKLDDLRRRPSMAGHLRKDSWLLQGGMVALGSLAVFLGVSGFRIVKPAALATTPWLDAKVPLAQIRYEDKNRVKVQYVRPELLQSIEFETSTR